MLDGLAYECYLIGQMDELSTCRMRSLALWRVRWRSHCARETRCAGSRASTGSAGTASMRNGSPRRPSRCSSRWVPTHELAMAYSNLSQLAMLGAQRKRAIEWGELAIELAQQLGNEEILAHALNNVGAARYGRVGERAGASCSRAWRSRCAVASRSTWSRVHEHVLRARSSCGITSPRTRICEAGIAYCNEHELDAWGLLHARVPRARDASNRPHGGGHERCGGSAEPARDCPRASIAGARSAGPGRGPARRWGCGCAAG